MKLNLQTKRQSLNTHAEKKRITFSQIFFTAVILFFLVCMISSPGKFISVALDGISAWAFNVLPSVLPFMFFTRVLSSLDVMPILTRPFSSVSFALFKTPPISIYTFCMAILSGYPVGSKMVADLYLQGKISKEEAFKMSSFCSNSGPMFIVGAVGIGMFHSAKIGYILFLSHFVGAILNGILYRNLKLKGSKSSSPSLIEHKEASHFSFNLSEIVTSSTLGILSVGCIITIFFIVVECFSPILSIFPKTISCFFAGLLEITKGCLDLSTLANLNLSVILCSFVISFGGISTILQSLTMLSSVEMPVRLFILQKITHAIFACATTFFLTLVI